MVLIDVRILTFEGESFPFTKDGRTTVLKKGDIIFMNNDCWFKWLSTKEHFRELNPNTLNLVTKKDKKSSQE